MVKKPDGTPLTPLLPIQTWHLACPSPTRSRLASVSRFPAHGDRVFVYIQSNTGILDRQTLFNKLSNSLSLSLSPPPLSLHIPRICRNSNSTESERILIPNFSDVNLNRDAILIEKEREREGGNWIPVPVLWIWRESSPPAGQRELFDKFLISKQFRLGKWFGWLNFYFWWWKSVGFVTWSSIMLPNKKISAVYVYIWLIFV
jgi:hypothetical protein